MNAKALETKIRTGLVYAGRSPQLRITWWVYSKVIPTLAGPATWAGLSSSWATVTAHPSKENVLAFRKIALDKATEAWSYGHSYSTAASLRDVATGLADIALMLDKPVDNVVKIATRAALIARDASQGTPTVAARAQAKAWCDFDVGSM